MAEIQGGQNEDCVSSSACLILLTNRVLWGECYGRRVALGDEPHIGSVMTVRKRKYGAGFPKTKWLNQMDRVNEIEMG